MLTRRAFEYRLSPTKAQEQHLLLVLRRCRHLYNSALEERRACYQMRRKRLGYSAQAAELAEIKAAYPAHQDIHSQGLQDVLRRLDKAFAAFFRRLRNGEKPGYPRLEATGPLRLVHLPAIGLCPDREHPDTFQAWRPEGALASPDGGEGENGHHQAGSESLVCHFCVRSGRGAVAALRRGGGP